MVMPYIMARVGVTGAVASVAGVVPSKSFNIERTDDSLGPHSSSSSSTTTVRSFPLRMVVVVLKLYSASHVRQYY